MRIFNTGGTFNKVYDPIRGDLVVPRDDRAVEGILQTLHLSIPVEGLIYKDSLDLTPEDRILLAQRIEARGEDCIVVHGTDTMLESAALLEEYLGQSLCIVLTGAMVPVSIDPREGSGNLMLAIAKLSYCPSPGVFVAMHGHLVPYTQIFKDRQRGRFCLK
ncbi:MAG: asparaginase [Nitratiruptor sp.]|nr:asparaginase [Nitratiruptor sp.]NPA83788.1 asparaginase [Campylobacterota bacterium]